MGTSGNPATAAAQRATASSAADFKKRRAGVHLDLPSGLTVIARRVDLQSFILGGNVPNPLMAVVSEALEKGQKADLDSIIGVGKDGALDLKTVTEMYDMVNRVVVACVSSPAVHPVPEEGEIRDDALLFVDEFDDEDKMFLFQWASGGVTDIATFREQARADLDALAEGQGASGSTE